MTLDIPVSSWLALASSPLVISLLYRIVSAYRSPLRTLPSPKRTSFLLGNLREAFKSSDKNYFEELTDTYGGAVHVHGPLGTYPQLCISDPEFLHHAFVSDHEAWRKPDMRIHFIKLVSGGPGVLIVDGEEHKRQRKMLNPMFTMANTRALTPSLYNVAHQLSRKISRAIASTGTGSAIVDVSKLASSTALDMIGSAALGYDFNALGVESVYGQAIKQFSPTVIKLLPTMPFLKLFSYLGPYSFRSWVMDIFCPFMGEFGRSALKFRHILETIHETGRAVYRDRQAFIGNEGDSAQISKTDVLSNLVRATSNTGIDEAEAISQINVLIFAGHETTANALARALDILATQQDLQDRLRAEVLNARVESGTTEDLPYEILMGLPLLDAIVRETLRLYPPVPKISRQSNVDMVIPLSIPVKSADGRTEITEVFVPKNTPMHISISGLNRSRAIWGDDAKEFKPERWIRAEGPSGAASTLAFSKIPGVFSSMMTFSGGPKNCLGWRMAVLEIKLALAHLVQRFKFEHGEQKIKWMYAGTTFPVVVGEEAAGPRLPLVVSEVTN